MIRRFLMAALISASLTLSGVSACSDSTGPTCMRLGSVCGPGNPCCTGLTCEVTSSGLSRTCK